MNGTKVLVGMVLFTILLITGFEIQKIYTVHDSIQRALRTAVDSGIIYGTIADDTGRGSIRLEEQKLISGTTMVLKKNLKLNDSWNSNAIKNGRLVVKLTRNDEGLPRAEAEFTGDIPIGLLKLFGKDGYTVRVPEKTPYLADYK